ncbi:hypothetical protein ACWCPM_00510 [Streptomyces sp. NPDC002309]
MSPLVATVSAGRYRSFLRYSRASSNWDFTVSSSSSQDCRSSAVRSLPGPTRECISLKCVESAVMDFFAAVTRPRVSLTLSVHCSLSESLDAVPAPPPESELLFSTGQCLVNHTESAGLSASSVSQLTTLRRRPGAAAACGVISRPARSCITSAKASMASTNSLIPSSVTRAAASLVGTVRRSPVDP